MAASQHGYHLRTFGRLLRGVGQTLDRIGVAVQGADAYVERLVPSTRVVTFKGKRFTYQLQHFVASNATVVGDVAIADTASLWYGATIRGDLNRVTIGRGTSVLDNATVAPEASAPANLGADVVVLPGAVVRSATLGDGVMVGHGATVQSGSIIGNDAFIDAGAVVVSGSVVPAGTLWTGRPASQLRVLAPEEMKYLRTMAVEYASLGARHAEQAAKSPAQVEEDAMWDTYREVKGMAPEAPIPTADPDVIKYYEMTAPPPDSGVFRSHEFNIAAEAALREADEVAADAEENAHYAQLARLRLVGEALKALSSVRPDRPAARERVIADIAARDPEAAAEVRTLLARAATATDATAQAALAHEISAADFNSGYADSAEREAASMATLSVLTAHARAGGLLQAPPSAAPATGGSVSA